MFHAQNLDVFLIWKMCSSFANSLDPEQVVNLFDTLLIDVFLKLLLHNFDFLNNQ